jgi:predicted nucleic acid-binding protein
MSYILDTCILSKLRRIKSHPDPKLVEWIVKHPETFYFISVVTLGEIQAGISKLKESNPNQKKQRMQLEDWLFGDLIPRFQSRLLDITPEIALTWGRLSGIGLQKGVLVPIGDGLIAATAILHGMIVVTENSKHFSHIGVEVINPWGLF